MELKMEGFEACFTELKDVVKNTPLSARRGLQRSANQFKKTARDRTPDSGKEHKSKLKKEYGIRIKEEGYTMKALVFNSAPHFHLIERGHELIIRGKNCGFVPGKYMFEKTVDEYEEKMPQIIENEIEKELAKF